MADETTTLDETPETIPEPVIPTPEPPPVEIVPPVLIEATKRNTCKTCKSALALYAGENPLKCGTGFCETCGTRQLLKG